MHWTTPSHFPHTTSTTTNWLTMSWNERNQCRRWKRKFSFSFSILGLLFELFSILGLLFELLCFFVIRPIIIYPVSANVEYFGLCRMVTASPFSNAWSDDIEIFILTWRKSVLLQGSAEIVFKIDKQNWILFLLSLEGEQTFFKAQQK